MRRILLGLTIAVSTAACDLTSTGHGISVRIEAMPLVGTLGDTVYFTVSVIANSVTGVVISYGDSNGDQHAASGEAAASVSFKHVYSDTGSFMSRATVSDAVVGTRQVSQLIVVNPVPAPPPAEPRINGRVQK